MEWISVKDRLPEDNKNIICYIKNPVQGDLEVFEGSISHESGYQSTTYWNVHYSLTTGYYEATEHEVTAAVTHWMPLPEPPK